MILSGLILNKLRKKQKGNENFQDATTNANATAAAAAAAIANAATAANVVSESKKEEKTLLIVGIVIFVIMLIVCICAIVKASKICGKDTAIHIILILFIPLYALIFCFAGNSICKNPRSLKRK